MQLEVISKLAESSERPPIVLLHGAWHGAWCWQPNFLPYFASKGWTTHAISLRGHGLSEGREKLQWTSIDDYFNDLAAFVDGLDSAPIIVGHSMGGFVLQKYLERHSVRGGVLLASVPPAGTLRFNLRLIRRHPLTWLKANLTRQVYALVDKPAFAREWFFSDAVSDAEVQAYFPKIQDESYRASLDLLFLRRLKPGNVSTPMAVLGGELDAIFPIADVCNTAKAYGVEARIFKGMAHNLMCEPGWERVADHILGFAEKCATDTATAAADGH